MARASKKENKNPKESLESRISIRFLLHCHPKKNWKLRDMKNHPTDPNWESGSYTTCHEDVRQLLEKHDRVIDVVVKDTMPIVRSAFVISGAEGSGKSRKLYFDEYYFAGDEPIILTDPFIQYRKMKFETYVKKGGDSTLWTRITERYAKYAKGVKPASIKPQTWKNMTTRVSERTKTQKNVNVKHLSREP